MNHLNGIKIVSTPYATEIRTTFKVSPHPIKKRRRNWTVVRERVVKPCAYLTKDVIYMHPDLIAQLPKETV